MIVLDNISFFPILESYSNEIEEYYRYRVSRGADPRSFEDSRKITLIDDPIVSVVKNAIEQVVQVNLTLRDAELTCWPTGAVSDLHIHNEKGREQTDYNSILYLNDNFEGGEFYTNTGITIVPKTGRLTFFNGSKVYHGVKPVLSGYRNTITFWWINTIFK